MSFDRSQIPAAPPWLTGGAVPTPPDDDRESAQQADQGPDSQDDERTEPVHTSHAADESESSTPDHRRADPEDAPATGQPWGEPPSHQETDDRFGGGRPPQGAPEQRFDGGPGPQWDAPPPQRQFDGPPPRQFDGPPPRQFDGPPPRQFDGPPPRQFDGPPPRQFDGPPPQGQFDGPPPQGQFDGPPPPWEGDGPGGPWPGPPPGGPQQGGPPPGWRGPPPNGYPGPPPQQRDHNQQGWPQQGAPSNQQMPYPGQGGGYPPPGFAQGPPGFGPPQTQAQLDADALLRKARRAPQAGWRRTVHRISGGHLNPGDSRDTVYYDQLVHRLNAPVRGDFRVAVLSLKGGVGKTTTTIGLGSTFAHLRGDRVIAVDANPDLGTLAQRVPQQTRSTVRDVLMDDSIFRYSDIRAHTSQAPSRLEVLASERDPAVAETFGEQDYRSVMRVLQRFYNIILTDCGTGLSHSAMNGVLDMAQALILVSTPAMDGARSASATLDWLQAHGYGHLVSRAIVVLSGPRRGTTTIDIGQLAQHFLARTRAVQIVPYDQHLAEGAEIDLELLNRDTRRAFVELAATVAEDFAATMRDGM